MIKAELIYHTALDLLKKSVIEIPEDVYNAYQQAYRSETGRARETYDFFFSCREEDAILCEDTSHILFYITLGTRCEIEPEMDWWGTISKATEEATWGTGSRTTAEAAKQLLPPRVCDPVTLENFGTNCGVNMPMMNFNVATGEDSIEITAAPKGGGADMYGALRVVLPADGVAGVKKFVIDSVISALKGGKTCPPNIIGIGMGGGIATAAKLAYEAGALRPIGSRHPIKWLAELEEELLENINSLGIGPMGKMGTVTAFDVHVEYSWGHRVYIPVMFIPRWYNAMLVARGFTRRVDGKWIPQHSTPVSTTGLRYKKWLPGAIRRFSLRMILCKDGVSNDEETIRACKECDCVTTAVFAFPPKVVPNTCQEVSEVTWPEDLQVRGMSLRETNFLYEADRYGPVVVNIDTKGNCYTEEISKKIDVRAAKVYERMGLTGFEYREM